jgi:hypothetical protein
MVTIIHAWAIFCIQVPMLEVSAPAREPEISVGEGDRAGDDSLFSRAQFYAIFPTRRTSTFAEARR